MPQTLSLALLGLFSLFYSFYTSYSSTSNVCLWYRANDEGSNNQLNGEYIYQGEYNDSPYYLMSSSDCSIPTAYLYIRSSRWYIGSELGGSEYYARCSISSTYPYDCDSNWIFPDSDDADTSVKVTEGECPLLYCTDIKFSYTSGNSYSNGCSGIYDTFVDDYIWSKTINDDTWYLYFNYKAFRWVCSNNDTISSCYTAYSYASKRKWYDINNGESVLMNWTTNGEIANITCYDSTGRTPSPTGPTKEPTTPAPTQDATTADICMWYRGPKAETNYNMNLNGKYQYTGTYNGKNYYTMISDDCNLPVAYLYYYSSSNKWFISNQLGVNYYYALCDASGIETPLDCDNNWIFGSEDDPDPTAYLSLAPCPEVECPNGVKLIFADGNIDDSCGGEYETFVYDDDGTLIPNSYYKLWRSGRRNYVDRYLYFNHKDFRWMCSEYHNISSCYSYFGRVLDRVWYDININNPSKPMPWSDGTNITIECIPDDETTAAPVTMASPYPTDDGSSVTPSPTQDNVAATDVAATVNDATSSGGDSNDNGIQTTDGNGNGNGNGGTNGVDVTSSGTDTNHNTNGGGGNNVDNTDSNDNGGDNNGDSGDNGDSDDDSGNGSGGDSGGGIDTDGTDNNNDDDDDGDSGNGSGGSGSSSGNGNKNSNESNGGLDWWIWLIIILGVLILLGVIVYGVYRFGVSKGLKKGGRNSGYVQYDDEEGDTNMSDNNYKLMTDDPANNNTNRL